MMMKMMKTILILNKNYFDLYYLYLSSLRIAENAFNKFKYHRFNNLLHLEYIFF
jgi:hypothetical protein